MRPDRNQKGKDKNQTHSLPTAENEDVEFSKAEADADDIEALERAKEADLRQQKGDQIDG